MDNIRKKDCLVSVVIPVYNVEKYIVQCLDSIIKQTYENIEIIIVDDGSTDNCPLICDNYSEKDKRIKVVHKVNGGLSDARNAGIKLSKGEFICFVDSDDYVDKKMIQKLLEGITINDADICCCEYKKVKDNETAWNTDSKSAYKCISSRNFLKELYSGKYNDISFIAVCKLYRKKLFNNIWFPKGRYYEDTFTTHKLIFAAEKIAIFDSKLYFYRTREGSITTSSLTSKKIADGIYADIENVKTFEDKDIVLMSLALNYFCHSQYYKYLEIEQSALTRNEKKELEKMVLSEYEQNINVYSSKVKLSFKYRIFNFLFLMFPHLLSTIIGAR